MPHLPLLDPKLDVVFKRLFVEEPDLLMDLINAVRSTEPPVVKLDILNPQIGPEELAGKYIVLDILAKDVEGRRYNIEMQTSLHAGWASRSVYYLARALGSQLQSGEGYQHVQPVIGIHLIDFELFPGQEQACWTFELRDRQHPEIVLDRSLQLHMIELTKADRHHGSKMSQSLADWITYFKHWQEENVMQAIERPAIQKAWQHLHALSGDDLARHQAFVRERALRDEITEKAFAMAEGRAEGREEGRAEGQADLLRRQLKARFGPVPAVFEQQLRNADVPRLSAWGEQLMRAERIEDVFAN